MNIQIWALNKVGNRPRPWNFPIGARPKSRINNNITVRPYPQSCIHLSKTPTECHTPFLTCLMVHHHPYEGLILPVTHYSIPHGYDPRADRRLQETCCRTVYIRRLVNNQQSPSEACRFCAVASLGSEQDQDLGWCRWAYRQLFFWRCCLTHLGPVLLYDTLRGSCL